MRGQAVGQGAAAFEDAQNVHHDEAEPGGLGQFAGDVERAVERHAGVQQRGEFLGEEEDVAALASGEGRELELEGFLRFQAHVDGRQALPAQFGGDPFVVFGMQGAGAEFAIGGDCFEVEASHGVVQVGNLGPIGNRP